MILTRIFTVLLCLTLLTGCRQSRVEDYWTTHSIDYSDIQAAQDQFARFAELAVAAPEQKALAGMDALFDRLKEDEVAYYIYTDWMDGAFYSLLSPCRDEVLYTKAVERMTSDGILNYDECQPFIQRREWLRYNAKGFPATVPGIVLDGRRTLVLVLDLSCPSCRKSLLSLAEDPKWSEVRRIAICCGFGPEPGVEGWDYCFLENAEEVFDPKMTPVYFVVSSDGTVEIPYTFAV